MSNPFDDIIFQKKFEDAREVFEWYIQYIEVKKEIGEIKGDHYVRADLLKKDLKKCFRKTYKIKSEILPVEQVDKIIDMLYEEYNNRGVWVEV